MNHHAFAYVMLAGALCQSAYGSLDIAGVKDSADFAYKYEADVLPHDAGLGFYLNDPNNIFADSVSHLDGVLTINTDTNSTASDVIWWELDGGPGTTWEPHFGGGFTVEIRAQVFPNNNGTFGAALGLSDANSTGFFQMFFDHVDMEGTVIPTAPNNDGFHVYRIVSIANGPASVDQVYRVYRDGVQVGSDVTQITSFYGDSLRFGDFISGLPEANFDIDYIRWDTTGAWEPPATLLEGDLNADGFVGIGDLNLVLGNWNATVTPGDLLSGDAFDDPLNPGFVGIGDLNVVLGNWNAGTPPPASIVPEPASISLVVALASALGLRRRI